MVRWLHIGNYGKVTKVHHHKVRDVVVELVNAQENTLASTTMGNYYKQ
jgi:hypothetical protein